MTTDYDDSNWREEYKGYTSSRYELDLLENGPKSLAQSWMMGALHNKWKKMKGYKDQNHLIVNHLQQNGNKVSRSIGDPNDSTKTQ